MVRHVDSISGRKWSRVAQSGHLETNAILRGRPARRRASVRTALPTFARRTSLPPSSFAMSVKRASRPAVGPGCAFAGSGHPGPVPLRRRACSQNGFGCEDNSGKKEDDGGHHLVPNSVGSQRGVNADERENNCPQRPNERCPSGVIHVPSLLRGPERATPP